MSTAPAARPDRLDDSALVRITLLTPDPSSPGTSGMRATDVEVTVGARLGDLRRHLARLTGHPGWLEADRRLAVGHIPVDDEQPCGQPPLLAGSQLTIGRCARPADECAIDAHRHVAVVEGPDCGELRAVERTLAVGRHVPGTAALDRLELRDPTMSVRHAELAMRRNEVVARDAGSSNGTTLVRSGSPRRLRARDRRARTGSPPPVSTAVAVNAPCGGDGSGYAPETDSASARAFSRSAAQPQTTARRPPLRHARRDPPSVRRP